MSRVFFLLELRGAACLPFMCSRVFVFRMFITVLKL